MEFWPEQLMCTCFNFQLVSLLKNLPRYFIPYFSDCANSHIKKEIDIYDYFQFKWLAFSFSWNIFFLLQKELEL